MLERLHLVRHAEVENPRGVVYADLPGFGLSPVGSRQAAAAAAHLADSGAGVVVSSPLDRATATAAAIASRLGVALQTDGRLLEWRLSSRWAGMPWDDLDEHFPGEVGAYLANPYELAFAPETIDQVAERMTGLVDDLDRAGEPIAILVSHQDPLQALRVRLTAAGRARFVDSKPGHASVIALDRRGEAWIETASWEPAIESVAFPPPSRPTA